MVRRRQVLALGGVGIALLYPHASATACSISPQNRTPFNDRRSRGSIADFVQLLNEAATLPEEEAIRRRDEMGVVLEDAWVEERVGERDRSHAGRDYLFVREFRMAGGQLDTRPIEIEEINLIRRLGNRATYQFTMKRYSFHPADPEGCNGLFTHDAFYGYERLSCLATTYANRLQAVRRFPEWYLEGE